MHFTFMDGAIGYDCVRCGARCCRGLGFSLRTDELIPFIGKAPKLAPFLQVEENGANAFDLADGCWMLSGDGRCQLEVAHGRSAKPSVCRIFPLFVRRIGEQMVLDLQLLSCPLEDATELGPSTAVLRHHELTKELSELAAPFAKNASLCPGAPDDLLQCEAQIRDQAGELMGVDDSAALVAQSHGVDQSHLTSLRAEWRRYFDSEDGFDHPRPMALALPVLRMVALTTPGAAPWPRLSRALPAQLLATSFYMELSARAGRPPTLRGLGEVWRSTLPVRELLARWREVRQLPDAPLGPGYPAELRTAYARVQASSAPIGQSLAEASLPVGLRPLLLRLVADRLL
jgi:hypothetical protein